MRRLSVLCLSFLLSWLIALPVWASTVTAATYRGNVGIVNSSTAATYVSTVMTLKTEDLISQGYILSDFSNVAIQVNATTDAAFMPAQGSGDKWAVWAGDVGASGAKTYSFYTGGAVAMGGKIRYFPTGAGMTTAHFAEPGADFEFEQSGYVLPVYAASRNLLSRSTSFTTFISGDGAVTSRIESYTTGESQLVAGGVDDSIYNTGWSAQTFTPGAGFTANRVKLYLTSVGSPTGAFTVSIRATDGGTGKPTGSDLVATVRDASTMSTGAINFDLPNVSLTGGTTYAIVVRHPTGTVSNHWKWNRNGGAYAGGARHTSTNSGSTWTAQADDYYFGVYYAPSVTATGVTAGDLGVKTTHDGATLKLYTNIAGAGWVLRDSLATVVGLPATGGGWTSCMNYAMPYLEYEKFTLAAVLKHHVYWQNATTFTDQSGNGTDSTPAFRTTSSDADVTATLSNYVPVNPATAGSYTPSVPGIVSGAPAQPTNWFTDNRLEALPGAAVMNDILDATLIPRSMFWFPVMMALIVGAALVAYWVTRNMLMTVVAGALVIGVVAPLWILVPYGVFGFALLGRRETNSL